MHELINHIYIVSVPQFLEGGALRPFLHTCTAVAIMYHSNMLNDFGVGNSMVSAMIWAAEAAKIALSSPARTSANDVLLHSWGKAIHEDFEARNKIVASAKDMSRDQVIHQLSIQVQDLAQSSWCDHEEKIVMRAAIAQMAGEVQKSNALIGELIGIIQDKRGIPDDFIAASPPK